MKVCKAGKWWLNMDNFTNAVDQGDSVTVFFGEDDYAKIEGEDLRHIRDWLNEAHVKTEL